MAWEKVQKVEVTVNGRRNWGRREAKKCITGEAYGAPPAEQ